EHDIRASDPGRGIRVQSRRVSAESKIMEYNTILYIGYEENSGKSAIDELREKGYEVVSTDSPTEAVALLYVMRSVAAVVLGNEVREEAAFDLAYSLRQIRPNIPVIMMCGDQINGLPSK